MDKVLRAEFFCLVSAGLFVLSAYSCTAEPVSARQPPPTPSAPVPATPVDASRNTVDRTDRGIQGEGNVFGTLPEGTVTIRGGAGSGRTWKVEIASTERQRMYGLMFRRELAADRGMLFIFEDEDIRSFYMKNTLVPLDMIFIDSNGIVRGVVENARPLSLDSRGVDAPVRYVLEVNAFQAAASGVGPGSSVVIKMDASGSDTSGEGK